MTIVPLVSLVGFLVGMPTNGHAQTGRLELIGEYHYTYGDHQSLEEARQIAYTMAVRRAIESSRVFAEETATVNDPSILKALAQTIASGYLEDLQVIEQTEQGHRVSRKVRAVIDPQAMKNVIARELPRLQGKEPAGVDENQFVRILSVRDFLEEEPRTKKMIKRVEIVYQQKGSDTTPILIDFYDTKGRPLTGKRVMSQEFLILGEIRQVFFTMPDEARSYRVWLKK